MACSGCSALHGLNPNIEATCNEIQEKIEEARPSKYSNLTIKEQKAMQELQSRDDIVITDTDKGGAVAILDVEDYVKEAERQLKNKQNYQKINYDPTTLSNKTIHRVIWSFQNKNLLCKNISEGLKTENPKTPHFYLKPKLHKEGNQGRPMISSINCHTSKISEYVDYHLQPIVKEIPSYVQDTSDFLRKINQINFVPDNSYLVSLDGKSLYTNIPNVEGIKPVKMSLKKYSKRTASTKVITTFLALILTLNNFIFNFKNYLQIKGCAMGTICAPSYANIFMDHFERKFIYPFIKTFSLIYLRFIDNMFFIWTGSKTDLEKLLNKLNVKHPSIKFEYEISKEFNFGIPKYTLKTINYIPKYLERKQTAKPFLTSTQSIQNR